MNADASYAIAARLATRSIEACRLVGRKSPAALRAWSIAGLLFVSGTDVHALGLGPAALNSGLGEPLRLSVPVNLQGDEEVGCVQVRPRGDDLPAITGTRSTVIRAREQTRIEISSAQVIDEPVLGVIVSVGCTSPVAREYVVFLDPPAIAPAISEIASTTPVRRDASRRSAADARRMRRAMPADAGVPARTAARAKASAPAAIASAPRPSARREPTRSADATRPTASKSDRLTVAPTEAPKGTAPVPAPSTSAAATPPAVGAAPSQAATPSAAVPGAPAPVTAPAAAAAPVAGTSLDAARAREEQLQREQVDLQRRVTSLSDQITALRVQAASLTTRNQTLEQSAFAPWLIWLLIALAVVAIVIAGWMAWRYVQLRRSIDGAAWWSGNTIQRPTLQPGAPTAADTAGSGPLDVATRFASGRVPQSDAREPTAMPVAAAALAQSAAQERPRPPAKTPRFASPIATDFTVSDIEAAMATVRTVSPSRPAPTARDDSDFAPLGGHSLPSPFADPPKPPEPTTAVGPVDRKVGDVETPSHESKGAGRTSGGVGYTSTPSQDLPSADQIVKTEPLDFKLDIPADFDPLQTTSLSATEVDRPESPPTVDFELPASPAPLDFELPIATSAAPLTDTHLSHLTDSDFDSGATDSNVPVRHAATALDELFPSLSGPGADTILDLDERDAGPLVPTDVDRLTSTEVEEAGEILEASTQYRMGRFADLMNRVDAEAESDPLHAIAQLRQFVLRDEQIPTLLWLRLFELYRKVGKQPVYEALGDHFARRYHRPMIGWHQTLADRVPQTPLSALPTIDREIETKWGSEEGLERLRSMLCDRDQPDTIVFNMVLQRDLLDSAKVFPPVSPSTPTDFNGEAVDPKPL